MKIPSFVSQILLKAIAVLALASCAFPGAPAQAQESSQLVSIEEMLARDVLGPPAGELAAWQAFAQPLLGVERIPPQLRAELHLRLAIARYYTRDFEAAWQDISAAEAVMEQVDMGPRFSAELMAYASLVKVELGDVEAGQYYAENAQDAAGVLGAYGRKLQALAQNARGFLAFARNDLFAAEEAFCSARDLGLEAQDPFHAMIVNDAGSCAAVKYYLERGDTVEAARFASDYAFANLPQDHPKIGNVLNITYAVLISHGRYGEAAPLIRRHIEFERALRGDSDPYVYDAMSMLGQTLERLGKLEEAEGIFAAAVAIGDEANDQAQPYIRGISRSNHSRVLARLGRVEEAETRAREGLGLLAQDVEAQDYHNGSVQVQLAAHLVGLGRLEEALSEVDAGLVLLEAGLPADHSEINRGRLVRARILSGLGQHQAAMALARPVADKSSAGLFDIAASQTEMVSLSQILPDMLGDYVLIALQAGEMEEAVRAAQLFLLSDLTLANASIRAGATTQQLGLGEQLAAYDRARTLVRQAGQELTTAQAEGAEPANLAALSAQLAQARAAAQAEQAVLEERFPEYLALARPQPATLADLQAAMAQDDLLVLPLALQDRAVTIAIGREQVAWSQSPVSAFAAEQAAAQLRSSAQIVGHFDRVAARMLYRTLLPESLARLVAQKQQLLFPSAGYLARLSPAILLSSDYDEGDLAQAPWLVRSHAIKVLADPGALAQQRDNRHGDGFLGVGAPSMLASGLERSDGLYLPPLPRAEQELRSLAATLAAPRSTILAQGDATEANLAALQLSEFGTIAFATHGLLGGEIAGLSEPALLMSPSSEDSGPGGDGLLTASEIALLELNADWVILSACETAAGQNAGAPGYSGLARAFIHAGARRLLLSHWRVRDDAAAFLSVETLRGSTDGLGQGQALREAQLALMGRSDISDAGHPAIWAPFVILDN